MLARLMPREGRFFDLFNAHAERIVEGSRELAAMIGTFSDLDAHAQRIDGAERAADKITHECITLLHKTFITPFDREQIHRSSPRWTTSSTSSRTSPSRSRSTTCAASPPRRSSSPRSARCAASACVPSWGCSPTSSAPMRSSRCCEEIDRLESDADRVMRAALSKLFRDESDLKQVMKLRVIYELLESITDRCEDVANVIEGIVLENS